MTDLLARQGDTLKRWQAAYKLAETYSMLNQSKPSFEAQFKVDQARELFLSLSEDYVTLGMTMARFSGAPVVPRSTQQHLDTFRETLDGHMEAPPDDRLEQRRRKVLDTLLDPKQTDPHIGIQRPERFYEKCQDLGISAEGAIKLQKAHRKKGSLKWQL